MCSCYTNYVTERLNKIPFRCLYGSKLSFHYFYWDGIRNCFINAGRGFSAFENVWKVKKITNCLLGRGLSALASDFIGFFHLFATHLQRGVCSQQLLRFWIFKGSEKVSTFENVGAKKVFAVCSLPAQTSELSFFSSLAARCWGIVSYLHITFSYGRRSQPLRHLSPMEYQNGIHFLCRQNSDFAEKRNLCFEKLHASPITRN